jgi:hypothetical protein
LERLLIEGAAMLRCYLSHLAAFDEEYDTIGVCHRNQQGVFVIHEEFGEQKVDEYSSFLSRPFTQEVSLRKLRQSNSSENKNKRLLYNVYLAGEELFLKHTQNQGQPILEGASGMEFNKQLLKRLKILPEKEETEDQLTNVNALDQRGEEGLFKEGLYLDNRIIVRSRVNADLIA